MNRDWPPPPQPQPPRPKTGVVITMSLIVFLVVGSVLASWLVAVLPGDHNWAPVIVPAGWGLALLVFLLGSILNWRNTK